MSNFNPKLPSIIGGVIVTALIVLGCFLTNSLVPLVGLPIVGAGAYILSRKGSNEKPLPFKLNIKIVNIVLLTLAAFFAGALYNVFQIDGFQLNEKIVFGVFITALVLVGIKMFKIKK